MIPADPTSAVPELAKTVLFIINTFKLQANGYKLQAAQRALEEIHGLLKLGENPDLDEYRNPNEWKEIHEKMSILIASYQDLFQWVGKMNKRQKFFNFWTIRRKIFAIQKQASAAQLQLEGENASSQVTMHEALSTQAAIDELRAMNRGKPTPAQLLQKRKIKRQLNLKIERGIAALRKLAEDLATADELDLVENRDEHALLSSSLAAVITQFEADSGSTVGPSNTVSIHAPPVFDEKLTCCFYQPAVPASSHLVKKYLDEEEERNIKSAEELYKMCGAEEDTGHDAWLKPLIDLAVSDLNIDSASDSQSDSL
ncbi:hypothetical protein EWM64_g6600 [Hericium alpestre]|uniref:Uncharacterized protein n=1 Tax=Hericium alpestre TaxID=135208 RepID=A0A4Y9ZTR6_9AGAM|nr:hypothetical protein EWM64_g6600 [Hericium alpestre]